MTPAPVKTLVSIDALEVLDVRVETIRVVTDVANSKKLVKLQVDFGDHRRQVLGLKQDRPDPSIIVGLQALCVVNLEPRTIAGERSEGLLFDIGYADPLTPVLAGPGTPVPDGARAG